jgi:hypothetical protein
MANDNSNAIIFLNISDSHNLCIVAKDLKMAKEMDFWNWILRLL